MSTKFYLPRHRTDAAKTEHARLFAVDTDAHSQTLGMLFTANSLDPLSNGNWIFDIVNYDYSQVIEHNVDWKKIPISMTAGQYFTMIGKQ
jgi:hypothetical protein